MFDQFTSLFEIKPKVVVERLDLEVVKASKVTSILFPSKYTLVKDSSVFMANMGGTIIFTAVTDETPEILAKHSAKYNVIKNSINSQPIAAKLAEFFGITDEAFSLNAEVTEVEGHTLLVVSKKEEKVVEEEVPEEREGGEGMIDDTCETESDAIAEKEEEEVVEESIEDNEVYADIDSKF